MLISLVLVSGCADILQSFQGYLPDTATPEPTEETPTPDITETPEESDTEDTSDEYAQVTQAESSDGDDDVLEPIPIVPDKVYQQREEEKEQKDLRKRRDQHCFMECEDKKNVDSDWRQCVADCVNERNNSPDMAQKWKCCQPSESFYSKNACHNACGESCLDIDAPCPKKFKCCSTEKIYETKQACLADCHTNLKCFAELCTAGE
ncbi:MAG: hypothetical protein LUO98_01995 [Methanoregula sp.]|nr:hypothetical protein [Methanoregula sp.]